MKKYLLAILLLPSPVFADEVTTGSIGLLKPSTGVIDRSRRWDDKLNGNFDMLAATITTALNHGLSNLASLSTTSAAIDFLKGVVSTTAVRIDGLQTTASTTSAILSVLQSAASTTAIRIDDLQVTASTISTRIDGLQVTASTIQTKLTAVATDTTTIATTLSQRTLVVKDDGATLTGGNVTSLDLVGSGASASQVGSTVTLTITGSGGGATLRAYNVYLGTSGAVGVDIANGARAGIIAALDQCGSSNCSIFMRPGVYQWWGVTIPANVQLFAVPGSSTVVVGTQTASHVLLVDGRVDGLTFDFGSTAYTGRLIELRSNHRFYNNRITGSTPALQPGLRAAVLSIYNATNGIMDNNEFIEIQPTAGLVAVGDMAPFFVFGSTNCIINRLTITEQVRIAGNTGTMAFERCKAIKLTNSYFPRGGGQFLQIQGGNIDMEISNNYFGMTYAGSAGNPGYLLITTSNGVDISSGLVIANNKFAVWEVGTGLPIHLASATRTVTGLKIKNNVFMNQRSILITFITIAGTNTKGAIISDNQTNGNVTFLSDAGTSTQFTTLQNFNDITQQ